GWLRNPVVGFLLHGFDQNRELELLGPRNALTARDDDEIRDVDAMIMQNFLRDALVFAENQTGRAATGKGDALHFQKGNDVLIEPAVILELIRQIKNHVRLKG